MTTASAWRVWHALGWVLNKSDQIYGHMVYVIYMTMIKCHNCVFTVFHSSGTSPSGSTGRTRSKQYRCQTQVEDSTEVKEGDEGMGIL